MFIKRSKFDDFLVVLNTYVNVKVDWFTYKNYKIDRNYMFTKYCHQIMLSGTEGIYPDIVSIIKKIESQNIFWYCSTLPCMLHPMILKDGEIDFVVGTVRPNSLGMIDEINPNEQLWTTCLIKYQNETLIRIATKHNFEYYDDTSNEPIEKEFELMNLYTTDFSKIEIISD